MPSAAEQLASNVRHFRKHRALSQEQLAERAEISVDMVSRIERAITNPTLLTLVRLARALDVPLHELVRHL